MQVSLHREGRQIGNASRRVSPHGSRFASPDRISLLAACGPLLALAVQADVIAAAVRIGNALDRVVIAEAISSARFVGVAVGCADARVVPAAMTMMLGFVLILVFAAVTVIVVELVYAGVVILGMVTTFVRIVTLIVFVDASGAVGGEAVAEQRGRAFVSRRARGAT